MNPTRSPPARPATQNAKATTKVKCLTICQPWAWSIVFGSKRYENRSWFCHYRGPLLIHAGRSRQFMVPPVFDQLSRLLAEPVDLGALTFGAIIGVCQVIDCIRPEQTRRDPWAEGPWCIKLAHVKALPTVIPCSGQRRLFEVHLGAAHQQMVGQLLSPPVSVNQVTAEPSQRGPDRPGLLPPAP